MILMNGGAGGRGQNGGIGSAGEDGKDGSELSAEEFMEQYPEVSYCYATLSTAAKIKQFKNHTVEDNKSKSRGDFYYVLRSNKGNKVTFSEYQNLWAELSFGLLPSDKATFFMKGVQVHRVLQEAMEEKQVWEETGVMQGS